MSRRRIMVTGGFGFVGASFVRRLVEQGEHEVSVLDDCSLGVPENLGEALSSVAVSQADVRDGDAVARALSELRPELVVHLAALHFIPACDAEPKRCIDVNVGGTQAVLDACAAAALQGVVIASTAAVYAPDEAAHSDESTLGPSDVYGLSKLFAERLGALFERKSGIPIGVARLFNVFGPGETNPHLIPAVIRQAQERGSLKLGNLSTRRDYVFVDDVAAGLEALSGHVAEHGSLTCNLGRERAVDGFELVASIGRLLGEELQVDTDPGRMRPSDRPVLLSDCSRAHEKLGWSAQTSLEDGLRAAIARPTAVGVDVD